MCGRFILIPQDELQRIIADVERNIKAEKYKNVAASATAQEVYPKGDVPIIVPDGNRLETAVMKFGYERAWSKTPLPNTRADTAMKPAKNGGPNMWEDSLKNRRCLVPTYGFYEPHMKDTHPSPKTGKPIKDQYYFRLPDSDIVMLAGIYELGHFSIMTTHPNAWMENIHPRMPVVLRPEELKTWLYGDFEEYTALFNRDDVELVSSKAS